MFTHSNFKKSILILSFFFSFALSAYAQNDMIQRIEPEAKSNYGFGIAINGGVTIPFTDVQKRQSATVFGLGINYKPLPFLQINLDLQKGNLKEGRNEEPYYLMNYHNSYFYTSLMAKLMPVELLKNLDDNTRKYLGIYGGMGLAAIFNNVDAAPLEHINYGYIDNYTGANILIPIEVGYSVPVYQLPEANHGLFVNINFRRHFSFTDKLDGYVPNLPSNKKKDVFAQLTFGLLYSF